MKKLPKEVELLPNEWSRSGETPARRPGRLRQVLPFLLYLAVSLAVTAYFRTPPKPRDIVPPGHYAWTAERGLQPAH
jgi:hypothetical protein